MKPNEKETIESSVMNIRVPVSIRKDFNQIQKAEKRDVRSTAAIMLEEYAPIKLKLSKPLLIKRSFKIGTSNVSIEPHPEDGGIIFSLTTDGVKHNVDINVDDKECVIELICNLLMYTNSI